MARMWLIYDLSTREILSRSPIANMVDAATAADEAGEDAIAVPVEIPVPVGEPAVEEEEDPPCK